MRALALALLLVAAPLLADEPPAKPAARDLSALVKQVQKQFKLPAMGAAIVGPEGLRAIGVSGLRALGQPTPVTIHDRWHIGSCAKAMTATLIARLVEQGKLTWTTTIGEALGEAYPKLHPGMRDANLIQLLSHTSGMAANPSMPQMLKLFAAKGTPRESRRALLTVALAQPPAVERGAFRYSNLGYTVAGAIAEAACGEPYLALLQRELARPLGITSLALGAPGKPGKPADQPRGHGAAGAIEPGGNADNPPALGPAGTLHCTLTDWARFARLHLRGAIALRAKPAAAPKLLVGLDSFRRLHEPQPGPARYALGWAWIDSDWSDQRILFHNGSNTMWYCNLVIAPRRGFALLVTTNTTQGHAKAGVDRLTMLLAREAIMRKPAAD